MITKRIIPCLDVKNGRVVKGVNFEGLQDMADPVEMARYYNASGAESCFFNPVYVSDELKQFTWQGLYALIEGRKTDPKEGSYTTYLFDKGLEKILKKVGEESTEVIIAGSKRDREETIYEISDLAYHVMVLMIELGISVEDITKELEKRHVIDHKVKQERMQ